MNIKSILIASTLFLSFLSVSAQTVDELCASHVKALGGESVTNVKNLEMTQIGNVQGMTMPMTIVMIPGKAYYQKIRTTMGIITTCAYGSKGWNYTSMPQPRTTDLPEQMTKLLIVQSKFYGPIYDYYIHGDSSDIKSVTLIGTENVDQAKCYNIEVTYKSGYKANVYLSSKDYMIYKVVSPSGSIKYGDYKQANGVMIARHIERNSSQGNSTETVSKVNINGKIANDLFTRP